MKRTGRFFETDGEIGGGMRPRELGEQAELDYASTAGTLRRLKEDSSWNRQLAHFLRRATRLLSNVKT